ncbi:ABC transporter ATP-binding protein [Thermomonas hydrothermalis]|uniref:ATP-binding cassette, subfamily B n=1 Tax=Thermomonas hydrothermalis TaxID=213588 RepID=A0A1M4VGH6_9GAMM|nr:ABC transporter ATP-binding protein [Thermomonas hydrothermalis]SHE68089.1 ATP-binding cassette, subfamily B [Thermomonas hydrothermalis]
MPAPTSAAPLPLPPLCPGLTAHWQPALEQQLAPGETALAAFRIDLDPHMRYAEGVVILTDRRLLAHLPGASGWQDWPLSPDLQLRHGDHGGIGHLELLDARQRLLHCRFTLDQNLDVLRLLAQFERWQQQASGLPSSATTEDDDTLCPLCKAPLPADAEDCPVCTRELHTPPSTWTLLRLWRFARPYRGALLAGFLLTLASTGATLVPPYLTMPLMDKVLIPFQNGTPIDQGLVLMLLAGILGAALLAWVLGWARTYILALVSERIGCDLRTVTYEHLLNLSLEYFTSKRTGDLMSRIGSESDRICLYLSLNLLDFATDVLMLAMIAAILFSIHPGLALVTLLPLPLIAWMIQRVRERLRTGFEKIDRSWSELSSVLADTIPGIRVVKAFAQEPREIRRFRTANQHYLAINDRLNKTWALFSPTVSLLTELGLVVVWAFGIWQVAHHQITVGVLTAFLAYIGRFYTRLDSMSRIVSATQRAAAAAKRIFDVLDHVSSVPEPAQPVPLPAPRGALSLRDVGFRYGSRGVLRGVSLEIQPGEMIGLVGHSGSGKTTLVNLICRFYDVTQGAILVDGVDIRSIALSEYRRHIGLVLQEPFLFFGTVAENIAYGKPDATREEIIAAARAAHAHEFILRLPHGYDSLVGERGQGLSGGERQRISIARALLINPRFLILDEATSSVDTETEKEIQRALDNLVKGRTTLAIAHRLSTLRKADRLVVMDRGRIVEVGPHDELMARRGAYWRLYQAQLRNVDQEDAISELPRQEIEHVR